MFYHYATAAEEKADFLIHLLVPILYELDLVRHLVNNAQQQQQHSQYKFQQQSTWLLMKHLHFSKMPRLTNTILWKKILLNFLWSVKPELKTGFTLI